MEVEEIKKRLAENIRKLRKEKSLTQLELAIKSDLSEAMIKSIELNRSWPSEKTLSQLSKALDVDIYRFFIPVAANFSEKQEIKNSFKEEIVKDIKMYIERQLSKIEF